MSMDSTLMRAKDSSSHLIKSGPTSSVRKADPHEQQIKRIQNDWLKINTVLTMFAGDPSFGAIVNSKLPVTNASQLKVTRLARPVQVHKSHSVIYSSKYHPEEKTFDNTSHSDDVVPWDKICSYCNVGVVENNFTFAGVLLCVICFPFGFAWLFCMMESQCPHCGKIYL